MSRPLRELERGGRRPGCVLVRDRFAHPQIPSPEGDLEILCAAIRTAPVIASESALPADDASQSRLMMGR